MKQKQSKQRSLKAEEELADNPKWPERNALGFFDALYAGFTTTDHYPPFSKPDYIDPDSLPQPLGHKRKRKPGKKAV